jgi:hypothetical protein
LELDASSRSVGAHRRTAAALWWIGKRFSCCIRWLLGAMVAFIAGILLKKAR